MYIDNKKTKANSMKNNTLKILDNIPKKVSFHLLFLYLIIINNLFNIFFEEFSNILNSLTGF